MDGSDELRAAHHAARRLLVTTVNFCRTIDFAWHQHEDETAIVSQCLSRWGSECAELRKLLAVDGVAESFSRTNDRPVKPHGTESKSYHAALLAVSWKRLRSVQIICGLGRHAPVNIDAASVPPAYFKTMAGAMKLHGEFNHDGTLIDLEKELERATKPDEWEVDTPAEWARRFRTSAANIGRWIKNNGLRAKPGVGRQILIHCDDVRRHEKI